MDVKVNPGSPPGRGEGWVLEFRRQETRDKSKETKVKKRSKVPLPGGARGGFLK
jgi:hypothetical protein